MATTKIIAVQHDPSGLYLYDGKFQDLPKNPEKELFGFFSEIKHRGKFSEGIIDTDYFSPSDFDKEEWDDEDDTTDDYSEVEIEI